MSDPPTGSKALPVETAALAALCEQLEASARAELPEIDQVIASWNSSLEDFRSRVLAQAEEWSEAFGLSRAGFESGLEVMLAGASPEVAEKLAGRIEPCESQRFEEPLLKVVLLTPSPPLLALQALLPALLSGSPLLLKISSREPKLRGVTLTERLVQSLRDTSKTLGATVATVEFEGGTSRSAELEQVLFEKSQRLIVYGGAAAVSSLEARFGGKNERALITHGPKLSLGLIDRSAVAQEDHRRALARRLVRDICLFDQRGCLSLHWIVTDADLEPFIEALEHELSVAAEILPPGSGLRQDFAAVWSARTLTAMSPGGYATAGPVESGTVLAQVLGKAAVRLEPSPGGRSVRLYRVRQVAQLASWKDLLEPWRGQLQGLALDVGALSETPFREWARQAGISHVCRPGALQEVGADWANGGHDPVAVYGRRSSPISR